MLTQQELLLVEENERLAKNNKPLVPIPINTSRIKQMGTRGGSHQKYSASDMATLLQSYGIMAKSTSPRPLLQTLCHLVATGKITKDDIPPGTLRKPLPRWLQANFEDQSCNQYSGYIMSKKVSEGKAKVFAIMYEDSELYFKMSDAVSSRDDIVDFEYDGQCYHANLADVRHDAPKKRPRKTQRRAMPRRNAARRNRD